MRRRWGEFTSSRGFETEEETVTMERAGVSRAAVVAVLLMASWVPAAEVRPDHPRMLLNAETLPLIQERARGGDKPIFDAFLERLEKAMDESPKPDWHYASYARAFGFAYLVTGQERYARKGVEWLRVMLGYHLKKVREGRVGTNEGGAANWETVMLRRVNYVAYDWLFNAMTPAEREELGQMILAIADIHKERETWNHAYAGGYNRFENDILAGLAVARSGVDDAKAAAYLKSGFDFYMTQHFPARNQVASDDGGIAAGMGYAFYNYIPVEAFFLKSWLTATGEDLTALDNSLKNFGVWALYSSMPDRHYPPLADVTPKETLGRRGLMMAASLYRDGRAAWLAPPFSGRYILSAAPKELVWTDPSVEPIPPDDRLPKARHFQGLGWVAMRSDWSPQATWAILTSGNRYYGHIHRDQNHFVIFKHALLATDPMERVWTTTGHNTLLVFDGDDGTQRGGNSDMMVRYREEVPLINRPGEIVRFETNDLYTYTTGDASRAYEDKVRNFTRQFVFLYPNTFVVFDRVTSTKPDSRKVWQLHADTEPTIARTTTTIVNGEGKLTSFTLLPRRPAIRKEFQRLKGGQGTKAELWNLTVEAPRPAQAEQFLHVLYASDKDEALLPTATLVEEADSVGARITLGETVYTVTFAVEGEPAGHVRIVKDGSVVADRDLTEGIQPQAGYAVEPQAE